MRFAGLLFDNVRRLPSGLGLQVFLFVRFAVIGFAYNFKFRFWKTVAGLILDTICTPGRGYDLQAWCAIGHGSLAWPKLPALFWLDFACWRLGELSKLFWIRIAGSVFWGKVLSFVWDWIAGSTLDRIGRFSCKSYYWVEMQICLTRTILVSLCHPDSESG